MRSLSLSLSLSHLWAHTITLSVAFVGQTTYAYIYGQVKNGLR
jgi:hypothetical protein